MKKIFIITILILFAVFALFVQQYLNPLKIISENGFSFSYNKYFSIKESFVESSSYIQYSIKDPSINRSRISVSIPIKNGGGTASFKDQIKDLKDMKEKGLEGLPDLPEISDVVINGHDGREMVLKINNDYINQVITLIQLESKYSITPVLLVYTRYDEDSSLDETWNLILKTIRY